MRLPVPIELHLERHGKMLEWQELNRPWIPTIRELNDLWGLRSTSAARNEVLELVKLGLVKYRTPHSMKMQYYAIRPVTLEGLEGEA